MSIPMTINDFRHVWKMRRRVKDYDAQQISARVEIIVVVWISQVRRHPNHSAKVVAAQCMSIQLKRNASARPAQMALSHPVAIRPSKHPRNRLFVAQRGRWAVAMGLPCGFVVNKTVRT